MKSGVDSHLNSEKMENADTPSSNQNIGSFDALPLQTSGTEQSPTLRFAPISHFTEIEFMDRLCEVCRYSLSSLERQALFASIEKKCRTPLVKMNREANQWWWAFHFSQDLHGLDSLWSSMTLLNGIANTDSEKWASSTVDFENLRISSTFASNECYSHSVGW